MAIYQVANHASDTLGQFPYLRVYYFFDQTDSVSARHHYRLRDHDINLRDYVATHRYGLQHGSGAAQYRLADQFRARIDDDTLNFKIV